LDISRPFLSRAYRENDYLLGRMHAVDRLIDIVVRLGRPQCVAKLSIKETQGRAFTLVLDAEKSTWSRARILSGVAPLRAGLMDPG